MKEFDAFYLQFEMRTRRNANEMKETAIFLFGSRQQSMAESAKSRTFADETFQQIELVTLRKKGKGMKKIEAIIRKTKFEEVKEALLSSDIDWFEYHNVHGIGQSRQERIYRGVQYSTDVIERVALTIVCRDQFVEPTVNVILRVAHTGDIGDGRIFVSEMIDVWSIRTGENGDTVLRDKK